ncbi:hypothetical protein D9M73_159400 [compost metagenome]
MKISVTRVSAVRYQSSQALSYRSMAGVFHRSASVTTMIEPSPWLSCIMCVALALLAQARARFFGSSRWNAVSKPA